MINYLPRNKTIFQFSKYSLIVLLLLGFMSASGQNGKVKWSEMGRNRNASFYDVQRDFKSHFSEKIKENAKIKSKSKGKGEDEADGGYKVFKKWESFMAPRVYPSGNMTLPSTNYSNFIQWKKNYVKPLSKLSSVTGKAARSQTSLASSGNWTSLGPIGSPSGPSPYSRTGAGRVNFVRFDPTNTNTMYVGAPDGGLWKSTNGGTTWTTNTDFLTVIGCADLDIDPTNTQIMYLATGDVEDARSSIGILKSTDGGTTWNTTGLSFAPSDGFRISKLLMNPSNPLNMVISTNGGAFSTTDGWVTNTKGTFPTAVSTDLKDMEFKPGDPNTVYTASNEIFKSIDNGINWTEVTTGLPSSNISRIALGVTAGNASYVYALIGKASDQSFLGMYRSTNSGTSFSLRSTSPNISGYNADGSDVTSGQAFYDLAIAVSPTNAEVVTTGGIGHWQSADGGTTWTNLDVFDGGEVHADIHEINYLPGSSTTIFSCNDGGIFKSTDNANNWTDISHNLAISQEVGIGLSANVATTIVNGEQDNGTNLKTGSTWANIYGGDGGECFIDYTNSNTIYIQYVNGAFNRSDDGGATANSITTGLPAGFDFYSKWYEDPVNPNRLYVGGVPTLYTSADKGNNWSALGTPSGTGSIKGIAVAPSNTTIIYAIKDDAVSKSTNSGTSFSNLTGTLPVANAALSSVTVSNTDPNKVWVTFSGYSAADKVYKSIDGGATWTNVSAGLPNLPVNIVVYTNGNANDAIYIGADIGVYYLDNTLSSFAPFMTALPNCAVRDLEIFYPTSKLRAGTFGRGVWESDLNNPVVTYTITASAGANGTISPSGSVSEASGANQTFTITPNACYKIATVLVDGVNNAAAVSSGTYTFSNVTANHTITATFSTSVCTVPAEPNRIVGHLYDLCGGGSFKYFVDKVPGATSYTWTVPAGFTITSGQGTNIIYINVPASFTTQGVIKVSASSTCGASAQRSLTVYAVTSDISSLIAGPASVTQYQQNVQYSVPYYTGCTYTWVAPAGATVTSGQGTNKVTVSFGNEITSCYIKVTVKNACGSSPQASKHVNVKESNTSTNSIARSAMQDGVVSANEGFKIYPNPVENMATVVFSSMKKDKKYEIRVSDISGRLLFTKSGQTVTGTNQQEFNISNFTNGMYLVTLVTEDSIKTLKLYKQKY